MAEVRGFVVCMAGCGASVPWKTTKRVCCDSCKKKRKRESSRKAMEKQRAKRGIKKVKGLPASCIDCGSEFVRYSIRTVRCKDCQDKYTTARTRTESAKRKTDSSRRNRYNEWVRCKRKSDVGFAVTAHMRTLMHRAFGSKKAGKSWRSFVDYSLEELMSHLEKQFLDGMTWENRGEWHIDHIIPRSSFEYDDPCDPDFKACWALSNLRPLWAIDNIRKNARITNLI